MTLSKLFCACNNFDYDTIFKVKTSKEYLEFTRYGIGRKYPCGTPEWEAYWELEIGCFDICDDAVYVCMGGCSK